MHKSLGLDLFPAITPFRLTVSICHGLLHIAPECQLSKSKVKLSSLHLPVLGSFNEWHLQTHGGLSQGTSGSVFTLCPSATTRLVVSGQAGFRPLQPALTGFLPWARRPFLICRLLLVVFWFPASPLALSAPTVACKFRLPEGVSSAPLPAPHALPLTWLLCVFLLSP